MEVQQLRAFLAVARHGGLAAAAGDLACAVTAIEATVRALERELDVALIDLAANPARLTAAGEELVEHAKPVLEQWDAVRSRLRALAEQGGGRRSPQPE